jgi:phosphoribosyl 1,2-cyclic phosphodiesterase
MSMNFISLSSGSSGNCYYIGDGKHGILVDAGISATSIRKFLAKYDIPMQSIMGVLISHNHVDHIKGLDVLTRKNHIPVFTTKNIWKSIFSPHVNIPTDCIREISLKKKFSIASVEIEAFPVSHDAPETIGFHIIAGGKKITIVTDLGYICDTSASYIREANLLVIESNYDEKMLDTGMYPPFLKKRIKSNHGHLGNHQTAEFLADNITDNLQSICLAHLSKNNNTPELAQGTLHSTLFEKGIKLNENQRIMVLNRNIPSEVIIIGDEIKPANPLLLF